MDEVVATLGPPDDEGEAGTARPEEDGQAPWRELLSAFWYRRLSETADLWLNAHADGRIQSIMVAGKYLGDPQLVTPAARTPTA